jgi:hypothetical protein
MKLVYVGHVAEALRAAGGKLSIPSGDPGQPTRKPSGTG